MIEAQQFILWLARRIISVILSTPKRWHDQLTDTFDDGDWVMPVILVCIGIFGVGFFLGIFFAATGHIDLGAIVLLSIWGIGALFVISVIIRAAYRVFKAEQRELIRALKQ